MSGAASTSSRCSDVPEFGSRRRSKPDRPRRGRSVACRNRGPAQRRQGADLQRADSPRWCHGRRDLSGGRGSPPPAGTSAGSASRSAGRPPGRPSCAGCRPGACRRSAPATDVTTLRREHPVDRRLAARSAAPSWHGQRGHRAAVGLRRRAPWRARPSTRPQVLAHVAVPGDARSTTEPQATGAGGRRGRCGSLRDELAERCRPAVLRDRLRASCRARLPPLVEDARSACWCA